MPWVEIPFQVEENYAGWRLDRYLQEKLKRASRAQVQRLIRERLVHDGARRLKPSTPVWPGLAFRLQRPEVPEPEGLPDRLTVLHDDPRVLVVDKPAGLPVHPTARYYRGTVTTVLGRDHRREDGTRPDPAHRLDRETSGVLVCGRDREATRFLKLAFAPEAGGRAHAVEKRYLAVIEGDPPWEEARIDRPLALTGAHEVRIRMSVVTADDPRGKPAVTRFQVLSRHRGPDGVPFALLACTLETGRQHQIRAHLHDEGLHLVGDKIYGPDENLFVRFTEEALDAEDLARLRLPRQALHAWRIAFPHPDGGRIEVEAPLPADLRAFLEGLQAVDGPPGA